MTTVNKVLQSQQDVDTVQNIMNRLEGYSAVTGQGDMEKVRSQMMPTCSDDNESNYCYWYTFA